MIINFTNNYHFQTRLKLNNKNIEVVDQIKILGTIFTNTLSGNENWYRIIKKVNATMQLLRRVWSLAQQTMRWSSYGTHIALVFWSSHVLFGTVD